MNKLKINECAKLKTEEVYIIIYAIKNEINIKKGESIEKEDLYTLIGVDKKGYRHFISIQTDKPNNNRYWLDFFASLKSKGTKNILFLSVDDNKNLKRTAKIVFPEITFVDSITNIVPKFYKFSSEKDNKKIASKISGLYTKKTINDFHDNFKEFKKIYNNVIHQKLIDKYLNNIEIIYKYSFNIRNMIFRYTANMEIYDRIRIIFNQHNSYINDINEISDTLNDKGDYFGFTSFKKKEWTLMINDLIQMYNDIEFI